MTNDSFLFQLQHVIQHTGLLIGFKVTGFIQAMNKSKINIIGSQFFQHPFHGLLDGLQIRRPTIFSRHIIGSKMNLKIGFFTLSF